MRSIGYSVSRVLLLLLLSVSYLGWAVGQENNGLLATVDNIDNKGAYSHLSFATMPVKPMLRVAVPYDLPPLSYISTETGKPAGIHVTWWHRLVRSSGRAVQLIALDLPQALAALQRGEVDLVSSVPRLTEDNWLLSIRMDRRMPRLLMQSGEPQSARIGVVEFNLSPYAIDTPLTVKRYSGLGALLRDLKQGELDGVYTQAPTWLYHHNPGFLPATSLPTALLKAGVPDLGLFEYYIAGRSDRPELIAWVNHYLPNGGGATAAPESSSSISVADDYRSDLLNLSLTERQFVVSHPTFRVGYVQSGFSPYHESTEEGVVGPSVRLLELIGQRAGLQFESVPVERWSDVLGKLKEQEVDLTLDVLQTPARQAYLLFSRAYEFPLWGVVTHAKSSIQIDKEVSSVPLSLLSGMTVALTAGGAAADQILGVVPDISVLTVADTAAALRAVAEGRADATIELLPVVRKLVAELGVFDLRLMPLTDLPGELRFASRRDLPLLQSILNKGLATLSYEAAMPEVRHDDLAMTPMPRVAKPLLSVRESLAIAVFVLLLVTGLLFYNRRLSNSVEKYQQTEAKLQWAHRQALDAMQAKSRFLAVMSHEIRTPLNGILGMMELIGRGKLDASQREKLLVAEESSQSLLTIINDILDFSRLDAGKLQLDRQTVSIDAVVKPVLSAMAVSAERKGVVFIMEIAPELQHGCYWLDPSRVRQVLFNLIGNAIKFTAVGKVQVTFQREQDQASERLLIQVLDTGIGIPKEKLEHLFDPFEQADASTSRLYGGSGLGLSISKGLAELMDGTLELESTTGLGTRACVRMPLKRAACDTCLNNTCSFHPSAGVSDRRETAPPDDDSLPKWAGHRLLLAEDHPVNRKVILEQLGLFNLQVDMAENGREALELYRQNRYSLVLADCQMPVMDGFELANALRQRQPEEHPTPVIAISAHAIEGIREACEDAGFTDVLTKPVSITEMQQLLQRYLPSTTTTKPPLAKKGGSKDKSWDEALLTAFEREALPTHKPVPEVLDVSVIHDIFGSEVPLGSLLTTYMESNQEDMARLDEVVVAGDIAGIRRVAHRMKGAARMIGASAFVESCTKLEDACHLEVSEPEELTPLLEALSAQRALLVEAVGCFEE